MTPTANIKMLNAIVLPILLSLGLMAAIDSRATAQEESPYQAFKLAGVMTDCVVPRLAGKAPDAGPIGPAGGEDLSDAEARAAYNCARNAMGEAYGKSGVAATMAYLNWTNYSNSPYISAAHGNRLVNNYANVTAKGYGQYEEGGTMPEGSVIIKDSFAVNANGEVVFGTLSLMEKVPSGSMPDTGDWRFTMVMPDGKVFGTSGGEGSERVAFCAACHVAAGAVQDSLFYLPKKYRITR